MIVFLIEKSSRSWFYDRLVPFLSNETSCASTCGFSWVSRQPAVKKLQGKVSWHRTKAAVLQNGQSFQRQVQQLRVCQQNHILLRFCCSDTQKANICRHSLFVANNFYAVSEFYCSMFPQLGLLNSLYSPSQHCWHFYLCGVCKSNCIILN